MKSRELPASVLANLSLLAQCDDLLRAIPPDIYSAKSPPVFPSSIGAHMRHVLDHYDSLLASANTSQIDYYSRQRDPDTEVRIERACERITAIREQLLHSNWTEPRLTAPIPLRISAEDPSKTISSSTQRELYFSVSHSIHHFALIAMTARHHGFDVPADFGVAPSTLAYRKSLESTSSPTQ